MAFAEIGEPKIIQVSYALALEMKNMIGCPGDRDIQLSRMKVLRKVMKEGEFRGCEWVTAVCNGIVYRVNGKHTSNTVCELWEEGIKVDFPIWMRKFSCNTLLDISDLYSTFDTKSSCRNKKDILKSYSSTEEVFNGMSMKMLSITAAGLSLALNKGGYRAHTEAKEQSGLLLQNVDFVKWVHDDIDIKRQGGETNYQHMLRASIIAAMYLTWKKDAEKATEFWLKIRNDSNDLVGTPCRVLFNWLRTAKLMGTNTTKKSNGTTYHAMFVKCLHAWNAWRRGVNTSLRYSEDAPIPTVV